MKTQKTQDKNEKEVSITLSNPNTGMTDRIANVFKNHNQPVANSNPEATLNPAKEQEKNEPTPESFNMLKYMFKENIKKDVVLSTLHSQEEE